MKKIKRILCIAFFAAFASMVCAGGVKEPSVGKTLTDNVGRKVIIPTSPTKIIVTQPADLEIVYELGAKDLIIGRGTYCDFPAEVSDIVDIGSGETLGIEQIIALEPDFVIMGIMGQTREQVEMIEATGVPVIATKATNIAEMYSTIHLIGEALGVSKKATALVDNMKKNFLDIENKAKQQSSYTTQSVYFEVSPLQWGLWTAGNNTFMTELANLCGIHNVFADVDGWAAISEEQVLEKNPDFIVTITMYFGKGPKPINEIMQRTGWDRVNAVSNKKILNPDANIASRPAPRLVQAAQEFYTFFYGDE
ncbi:MAG TPA: ABC transporter substrate-binding protein [Treponemataceae bacterium]|nr:ABC transporter substrate-binding protein [Treponemataceae bacterium]